MPPNQSPPQATVVGAGPLPTLTVTVSQLDMATGQLFLLDQNNAVLGLLQDNIHFSSLQSTVVIPIAGLGINSSNDLGGKRIKFLAIIYSPDGSDGESYYVSGQVDQGGQNTLNQPLIDTGTFQNLSHAALTADFVVT